MLDSSSPALVRRPALRSDEERVVYTVPCHRVFRNAVLSLANRRGMDVADLVRSVMQIADPSLRQSLPDPGEPETDERTVTARPRGQRRPPVPQLVPTLVLRLDRGLNAPTIRQCLALALALAEPGGYQLVPRTDYQRLIATIEKLEYRNRALAAAVERLSFQPRGHAPMPISEAAEILGLSPLRVPEETIVAKRFRELAPIFHPDTGVLPCRERMAQLIEARNTLVRHLRRPLSS